MRVKMRSSYSTEDVQLLLKDITGQVIPLLTSERERLIQSGCHYCEMLPIEYVPTKEYMNVYQEALENYAKATANAIGCLSDKIIKKRGNNIVLVSLARAGIPIGILIKRYLKFKFKLDIEHYSISIIRGKGIDDNAMRYLLNKYRPQQLLFVDGWVGKGAIFNELKNAIRVYNQVSSDIAVVADPANITELCGTHEDILIPSSCLNCTISGLISRTFLRDDIIGLNDFHGAVYYENLESADLSYAFISEIEKHFSLENVESTFCQNGYGIDEVKKIAQKYKVADINLIKPGIGETTRVLLRRVPKIILIDEKYRKNKELKPIVRLAKEKEVPIEYCNLNYYKCCGIIKNLTDI